MPSKGRPLEEEEEDIQHILHKIRISGSQSLLQNKFCITNSLAAKKKKKNSL
jgi:hypothetical protein